MAQNLSNLPIGAKVKFGTTQSGEKLIWLIAAKNRYESGSVTLFAEKVIDYLPYDAAEPTNTNTSIGTSGNARYSISNIRQWLNSRETAWYSAQHQYDAVDSVMANHGGFAKLFTTTEYNAIKLTSIPVSYSESNQIKYETITDRIFLPSCSELNMPKSGETTVDTNEGTAWGFPTNVIQMRGYYTDDVAQNYNLEVGDAVNYWTRTSGWSGYVCNAIPGYFASFSVTTAASGHIPRVSMGVRPALNLSSTLSISDTTDSDECYTFNWNSAPPVPKTLNVPTVYGGKTTTISWSGVTDPDGNAVTYQLEQAVNGGTFTTLYSGTNLSYSAIVAFGSTSVQFRLKAVDSLGASSGYITSTSRTVINNTAPTISGSNGNLGTKGSGFTQTYTISDTQSNAVTVTESIDGVSLRSYVATLGATNTFSVTGNTWLALANGSHTMTITATDGVDSSTRTYTFVKSISSFTISNTTPMVATTRPTRIKVSVTKNIPLTATFKVEVCNNGFDTTPTWEDATSSVNGGLVHLFTNTTKTAANWGVRIRVTVNRNGGSGECYVSAIGGNFE